MLSKTLYPTYFCMSYAFFIYHQIILWLINNERPALACYSIVTAVYDRILEHIAVISSCI
jgi:hypothetical protein